MLAAITNRLHAEALASLPPNVRRRIRGLRSLQKEFRSQIVNGSYEPTEEECQNPWRDETEEEDLAKAVANAAITEGENKDKPPAIEDAKPAEPPMDPNVKGIPDFWYTIFRNVSMLLQMHEDPIGFKLEFHFAPNDYFTDTVLTKEYSMKCKPDEETPLEFEGPEIYSCKGCEINWKKGKNVTVKTIKKKQKHKSRGSVRTVTKSIGHYIRERVVSRAVLLYTGEGLDEDDDDDYEEEEEEECSSEESEDDDPPPRRRANKKAVKGPSGAENPAECKQQ
ncbi:Nucleosome assembly protein isoform 1 [Operophtera brumata]|uniref:Nucleosome assembly protein isoform 1 n=1 Tax=Operophtera brumata TaxID=104452 RepID=A0A0L7LP29_OPEBR|nr:Nucleosome assembly protein isoform 1 [Operophtera brumata]